MFLTLLPTAEGVRNCWKVGKFDLLQYFKKDVIQKDMSRGIRGLTFSSYKHNIHCK